ncbi:MAG: excinuclease ABC subunit UvrC [Deltaproteobacteria bacterium]|nr:MAG: excinuclease ABC subunit UvrC [Deltaproteobacteria bacterium]
MKTHLETKIATTPTSSGVYLWKDARRRVIYVGKARNLRARLRQYLRGDDGRFFVPFLVQDARDVDVVLTSTEKEALLLENELIKQYRPRYNVKLVDDKNFLHLRIDRSETWPRFTLVRQIGEDGADYFGPYHSASKARDTLATLQRTFPLRTCTDHVLKSRSRPCLMHQMGRCVAPCVPGVDPDDYKDLVQEAVLMLNGQHRPLLRRLEERMARHADALEFERAAQVRDLIRSVSSTLERQTVVDTRLGERDLWGVYRVEERAAVAILPVREGIMGEPRITVVSRLGGELTEALSTLINVAYPKRGYIPPEICLPELPPDAEALAEVLSERRGKRVRLTAPQRGDKARLLALATENARLKLERSTADQERNHQALLRLAEILKLPDVPRRIECFDNSNLQGEHPVAAMSVFIDGEPARAEYRRYRIKTVVGADDYASMREILHRRLTRALREDTLPDLVVVDGGRGQLAVAVAALADLGLSELPVVGISKPRTEHRRGQRWATDKIVLPRYKEPLRLPREDPALRLLQHLRDEVHDAAIRYHRKVRRRSSLTSVLEAIPGVGPARRKALLKHLGSAEAVLRASVTELRGVPGLGPAVAQQIFDALHRDNPEEDPI